MEPGRPPMFSTPEEVEEKTKAYFDHIKGSSHIEEKDGEKEVIWDRFPEPPTITGLCLFLGFESRQSFYDYQEKDGFTYTIKKARLLIESEYEKALHRQSPTGAIFALKNMGWTDKSEIDHTSKGEEIKSFTLMVKPQKDDSASAD